MTAVSYSTSNRIGNFLRSLITCSAIFLAGASSRLTSWSVTRATVSASNFASPLNSMVPETRAFFGWSSFCARAAGPALRRRARAAEATALSTRTRHIVTPLGPGTMDAEHTALLPHGLNSTTLSPPCQATSAIFPRFVCGPRVFDLGDFGQGAQRNHQRGRARPDLPAG